ncbi:hypothetical protein [Halorubrum sp. 2020YC2]|nr:hypothetical protein [Halorubrum sp. 2020YC2]
MGDAACDRRLCPEYDLAVSCADEVCPECGARIEDADAGDRTRG